MRLNIKKVNFKNKSTRKKSKKDVTLKLDFLDYATYMYTQKSIRTQKNYIYT